MGDRKSREDGLAAKRYDERRQMREYRARRRTLMTGRQFCAAMAAGWVFGAGCADAPDPPVTKTVATEEKNAAREKGKQSGKPASGVTWLDDDDPKMDAAMEKARKTVDQFIEALQNPKPGQQFFAIKAPFKDGKNTEFMWLSDVTFDDEHFSAVIDNDPDRIKSVKIGQHVKVEKQRIADWMYVHNGKLVGNLTLRALRDEMTPKERKEFEDSRPYKFE
jgi:uncharacterized protein YegJ (DUF2314 family)